ncbi:MAG TPA: exonuclease domain-containing protein [Polyangia bacterium]|nr:exonuclease domain-containing protein [Polyangia bacterium]
MDFVVIDVETTGLDPKTDGVCEIGWCTTTESAGAFFASQLVNPGIPISPHASAVNHLVDADVANAPSLERVVLEHYIFDWGIPVAHNAPFDSAFLPMIKGPWLDTRRMARRYLPEAPQHSNQFLRYFLKLDVPRTVVPHRAEGDAVTTAALLRYLLNGPAKADFERLTIEDFVREQSAPIRLRTIGFGKYKGKPWSEAPRDYLLWLSRNSESSDEDTAFTVRSYL